MKKFLAIAAIAGVLVSCEDKKTEETTKDTQTIVETPATTVPDTTQIITTTTTETSVDTMKKEGEKK